MKRAELTIAKWGNSLAVRLPADAARELGLGEGDTLILETSSDDRITLFARRPPIDRAFVRRLRQSLRDQARTPAVIERIRRDSRY
jgi:antitoxin MazE